MLNLVYKTLFLSQSPQQRPKSLWNSWWILLFKTHVLRSFHLNFGKLSRWSSWLVHLLEKELHVEVRSWETIKEHWIVYWTLGIHFYDETKRLNRKILWQCYLWDKSAKKIKIWFFQWIWLWVCWSFRKITL